MVGLDKTLEEKIMTIMFWDIGILLSGIAYVWVFYELTWEKIKSWFVESKDHASMNPGHKILVTNVFNLYNLGELLQLEALANRFKISLLSIYSYLDERQCKRLGVNVLGKTRPRDLLGFPLWFMALSLRAYLYHWTGKRFFLNKMLKEALDHDLVIDLGGDTFHDRDLLYLLSHTWTLKLIQLLGLPYMCLSQTILLTGRHKRRAEKVLREAKKIVVRDSESYNALLSMKLSNVQLAPDLAFLNNSPLLKKHRSVLSVGLNLSPLVNHDSLPLFQSLVDDLKERGHRVYLIPHVLGPDDFLGKRDDRKVLEQISGGILIEDEDPMKIRRTIRKCHVFIGSRMHSVIYALSCGIPSILIGYSLKAGSLGELTHHLLPVIHCQDPDFLKWMLDHVDRLELNYDSQAGAFRDLSEDLRKGAEKNIEVLYGLLQES